MAPENPFPIPVEDCYKATQWISEALEYAKKLSQAGVKVVTKCFPEVTHGFIDLPIYEENQKVAWINEIAILLKNLRL